MIINRKRGDTRPDECTVIDIETGRPVPINGCSFVMTVDTRRAPTDSSTRQYQVIGQIVDGDAGRFNFTPAPAQVDRVGTFYYDIQMTDSAGLVWTLDLDAYIFTQDITK